MVVGIGNAIVDVLVDGDEVLLETLGMAKGSMTLVDTERAEAVYAKLGESRRRSGGSAANTMAGIASLGGRAAYMGKLRDDELGKVFRDDIRATGVAFDTSPATSGPGTGRCIVIVTRDAERSMMTYLGASATLGPDDIDEAVIREASITYLEGYLWDPAPAKEAFRKAASVAHDAGGKVALSLSDPFCVDRHRDEFRDLVAGSIDVLFANEAEVVSLFQASDVDEALEALKGQCELAVITRGAAGSVILDGSKTIRVHAEPVARVVDTTGAGDLFAAGFLFGLSAGRDPATCAHIGGLVAGEVISHYGARPETELERIVARRLG